MDETRYWGHSDVLNLDLCWESGNLRWYDPVSQRYIANYDDQANARAAAEAQLSATEAELDNERQARLAVERQASVDRDALLAAEARIRELEQEQGSQGDGH